MEGDRQHRLECGALELLVSSTCPAVQSHYCSHVETVALVGWQMDSKKDLRKERMPGVGRRDGLEKPTSSKLLLASAVVQKVAAPAKSYISTSTG